MIKWTTPTLKCNIPEGIEFDYIILTLKQLDFVLEKRIEKADVVNGSFNITFLQEETSMFQLNQGIECQLNILYGNSRLATNITVLKITNNLHDEVINND